MRAGQLRHFITVQAPTDAQDSLGAPVTTWETVTTAWAMQEDLSGAEDFLDEQERATVTTRFTIRYVAGIRSNMRITSDDGQTYNVTQAMDADGRRRTLVILAFRENA